MSTRILALLDVLLRAAINMGLLVLFGWIGASAGSWLRSESPTIKRVGYIVWGVSEGTFLAALFSIVLSILFIRLIRKRLRGPNETLIIWLPLDQWLVVSKVPAIDKLWMELWELGRSRLNLLWERFGFRQGKLKLERDSPSSSQGDRSDTPLHSANPTIFMGLIALIFGGFILVIIYNLIIVPLMNFVVLPILRIITIMVAVIGLIIGVVARAAFWLSILIFTVIWRAWESVLGRVLLILVGRLPVALSIGSRELSVVLSTPLWAALATRISSPIFDLSSVILVVGFAYKSTITIGGLRFIAEMDRWDKWVVFGFCGYLTVCATIACSVIFSESCWWCVKMFKKFRPIMSGEKL